MKKINRKDSKGRVLQTGEYERSNNTYEYRYIENGKRYSEYANSLTELRQKEKRIKKKKSDGINVHLSSSLTVCDIAKRYIITKKNLGKNTLYNYQRTLENYIIDSNFGKKKAEDIRKTDIIKYYDSFIKKDGSKKNGIILMVQHLLQPAFEMAVDDDILIKNPFRNALKNYGLTLEEKDALTIKEQEAFLEFVKTDRYYCSYYHMLVIMLGTGMRMGETIGLTWEDVNFSERSISINHQLQYKNYDGKGMRFYASIPKTKSGIRTLYMTNDVYESFKSLKKKRMLSITPIISIDGYKDFVFVTSNGTPFQPNSFARALTKCVEMCNMQNASLGNDIIVPHITPHVLRHTACTRFAEQNIDVKTLQYIMGHSTSRITLEIYDHVDKERVKNAISKIDEDKIKYMQTM